MASNYKKEPIFLLKRRWDNTTKLPEKYKFQGRKAKAEVCIHSGTLRMEFFLEKTLAQFIQAGSRLNWNWPETFLEFNSVLGDSYRTTWHEVLNEHFLEPLEEASAYSCNKKRILSKQSSCLLQRYWIIKNRKTYSIFIWLLEEITAA